MVYFAYGSNMLMARLVSRCPGAKEIGTARLAGYLLRFDKGSKDGSGKGTLYSTSNPQDIVYGVLFDVPQSQLCDLDQAEKGYDRKQVRVEVLNSEPVEAETYITQEASLDRNAVPYDWYMALLITGALNHDLPQTYVDSLRTVKVRPDPDLNRPGRLEALSQLDKTADSLIFESTGTDPPSTTAEGSGIEPQIHTVLSPVLNAKPALLLCHIVTAPTSYMSG